MCVCVCARMCFLFLKRESSFVDKDIFKRHLCLFYFLIVDHMHNDNDVILSLEEVA